MTVLVPAGCAPTPPADALTLGLAYAHLERWQEAALALQQAVEGCPQDALAWLNLARAHLKLSDYLPAASAARQALALDPGLELALTIAVHSLGQINAAQELAELFGSIDMEAVRDPALHIQYGNALGRLGRYEEAIAVLLRAVARDPGDAAAHRELGIIFQFLKMPEEARECYRTAQALGGAAVGLASAVVFCSFEASRWEDLTQDLSALNQLVEQNAGQPMPFYSLTFDWSREQLLAAARAHAVGLFRGVTELPPPPARHPGSAIRVGYVSSDLHAHATAYLIAELLECHDRDRFAVYAYSYGPDDGSPMRRRLKQALGERFVDAQALSNPALAARIRADGIDVLVDLKGYTLYARNELFGYRAAPLQVNYLGFPGTLGSGQYDYLIGDPVVTPLAHADGYAEKIAQMPHCYQPNDRQRPIGTAHTRAQWGLPEDCFVYCCFNANYKITPELFDCWCRLLHANPATVLWLIETNAQARRNLLAHAAGHGICAERIFWAPPLALDQHLARIAVADLFLDTYPVTAHTTASDALWAGLPLLTLCGETFVARVAASLLEASGLPELVAPDLASYERRAGELARQPQQLRALRERLAVAREHGPLFDSARYARDFEHLLERMVERHEAGLPPAHLPALQAPN